MGGWSGRSLALGIAWLVACARTSFEAPTGGGDSTLPPVCTGPCTVADSLADFSGTQGQGGFYYGRWARFADADGHYVPSEFEPMVFTPGHNNTYQIDNLWKPTGTATTCCDPTFTWTMINGDTFHPDADPFYDVPIRRWVSSVRGRAHVNADLYKIDSSGGDGVTAELMIDGTTLWTGTVSGTDNVGVQITLAIDLVPGTTIDVLFGPRESDAQDLSHFDFTITD